MVFLTQTACQIIGSEPKSAISMLRSSLAKAAGLSRTAYARSMCSDTTLFRPPVQMQAQILRFKDEFGQEHFGVPEDDFRARIVERSPKTGKLEPSALTVGVMEILPPIDPVAIYGVGLNYRDHAAETGKEVPRSPSKPPPLLPAAQPAGMTMCPLAVLFMKAPGSATGHRTSIVIPRACQGKPEVDYEVELAVIIGRAAKNVSSAEALEYVMGYTVANDVSARRWQGKKGECACNASQQPKHSPPMLCRWRPVGVCKVV